MPDKKVFNVPNQLSALRLLLSIVIFVLIPLDMFGPALVVFIIAASTDWIDGYWARRFGQVTQLGRMLDPFVDKIIVCGTFIYLSAEPNSGIVAWVSVVVVGREMLVTALRGYIEQAGGDFSAKLAGKLKMVFQCVAAGASLVALIKGGVSVVAETAPWIWWTLVISVWLAVITTVYSGLEYIVIATRFVRK